jgi:replication factor C subunit 3/5
MSNDYTKNDYNKEDRVKTLPWIEKYRPDTLDKVISHGDIINTLRVFIKNKCLPHLLFYGPPGTGKTSVITACAKQLYGEYFPYMVMELNASDDRGIEVVRTKIKQFVTSNNVFFGKDPEERNNIFKLVILDETDAMTNDAQAILRKVVEEYTYNTRFCLICNYIQNINPALQSRCTRFRFSPLPEHDIRQKIYEVAEKEQIDVTESGVNTLIKRARGDMRKILNNLQSVSMAYDVLDEANVNICFGYPRPAQMNELVSIMIHQPFNNAYSAIAKMKKEIGLSLDDIIHEIHDILLTYILGTIEHKEDSPAKYLSIQQISQILDKMRSIEFNQSVNTSEGIQLSALISVFKMACIP